MKKTIAIITTLCCFHFLGHSQYYVLPVNAGMNPGGLNTDVEYPVGGGLPSGWTTIQGPSATAVWSAAKTIPFTFNFNGAAVTQYKVSNTGVLTFDVSTSVSAPSTSNEALPSASIPDKSVCIWGSIIGSGTNDNVVTKTFGTSPNRQHWISFNSYSITGQTSCFTYWSIVLEESSDKIYVVDQRHSSCTFNETIGVQVDNSTAYEVSGSPNVQAIAGNDAATPSDNAYYEFGYGTQPDYDFYTYNVPINNYLALSSAPFSITAKGLNSGASGINSMDVNYSVNNGTPVTSTLNGLNIASGSSYDYTHPTTWNPSAAGTYTIKVWASNLNGNSDENLSNDTSSITVTLLSSFPNHKLVYEEGTGTWCGWCVRGAVYMDSIANAYPNSVITIAVHNGDPMVSSSYDQGVGGLVSGYPSLLVDRKLVDDPSNAFSLYDSHIGDFSYADLGVNANVTISGATRTAKVKVDAKFAVNLTGGSYRLALVFTEDKVTGTASGYAQHNYYSYMSQNKPLSGGGINYQEQPDLIPASDMVYNHVARTILGSFTGSPNSLPSNIIADSTYSYMFTYNIPAAYNISNMHAIALLIDVNKKIILNGNEASTITTTTGLNEILSGVNDVNVYPNPLNGDWMNIFVDFIKSEDITVTVTNVIGQTILNKQVGNMSSGNHTLQMNTSKMNPGVYFLNIQTSEGVVSRKFVKE